MAVFAQDVRTGKACLADNDARTVEARVKERSPPNRSMKAVFIASTRFQGRIENQ